MGWAGLDGFGLGLDEGKEGLGLAGGVADAVEGG